MAKLSADLSSLIQSTYIGGSHYDKAYALALSPTGDIYVAGWTRSTDFPGTLGGAQAANAGGHDAFVTRLDGSLTQILQSSYLGGTSYDEAYALAVSPAGDVYVAGKTESTVFPKTSGGAAQPSYGGNGDGCVTKFNASLTAMMQSTFLGGAGYDEVCALGVSPGGQIYATGRTMSANFPRAAGGAQPNYKGSNDVFIARLDAALTNIFQSTYLGGSSWDYPHALIMGPRGEVYVAGHTNSSDFPKTQGGAQASKMGADDAFVAKLDPLLTNLVQGTYLGGSDYDEAFSLAVASTGDVYVGGYTQSKDFPRTAGGAQESLVGSDDAFVARLRADLTSIVQATYLGGSNKDSALALVLTPNDHVYVGGYTYANNFPAVSEGAQPTYAGNADAFVAYLTKDLSRMPQPPATYTLSVIKSGSGIGTVTSLDGGISCGRNCEGTYEAGTIVTLKATAATDSTWGGWLGDCAACGLATSCAVSMTANRTCSARFDGSDHRHAWEDVQKIYVAYYGRPADPGGQEYWAEQLGLTGGSLDEIIEAFGNSEEFDAYYGGMTNSQLIDALYRQMFNRLADPSGKAFYLGQLTTGAMSLQSICLDILYGATGTDKIIVANKVEAAQFFTDLLRAHPDCSYTLEDIPTLRAILQVVDETTASVTAAERAMELYCAH